MCCCVGRAAWPRGVPGAGCLSFWAGLLGVPVGGGPPASRPRCELCSARRLVARQGPAAAHGCRSQAPLFTGTAVSPFGPSGVLHTGGACVAYGCSTTLRHCGRPGLTRSNFARNSPAITSNIEFVPLELQRFRVVSKNDRGKLCAKFVWAGCCCCLWILRPGPVIHRHCGQALRRPPHRWGLCSLWLSHYSSALRSTRPDAQQFRT